MPLSAPDHEQLRARLSEVLGEPESIQAIESGTTGESFRVETAEGRFAVKQFGDKASYLLGPLAQFRLLERLAPLGIAPKPAAADDASRLLVTEWMDEGAPAKPSELTEPERIAFLVEVLKALHSVDHMIPEYSPREYAMRYVDALGGQEQLRRRDHGLLAELLELAQRFMRKPSEQVICHNDLTADNIFVGAKIRLIDFDFAVLAPPVIDLASVAEMNRFDSNADRALLSAYFGNDAAQLQELAAARRLLCLLAHFWALASADASAAIVAKYRIDND